MLSLLMVLLATARADDVPLPTVNDLMALPSTVARVAALESVLAGGTTDGSTLAKAATGIQVLRTLESAGRDDPAIVRGFLEAALSDEPERREDAVEVAATGLPPGPRPPPPAGGVAPVVVSGSLGPRPTASLDALRAYDAGRLYRDQRRVTRVMAAGNWIVFHPVSKWTVFQDGDPLASREFARMVGDAETLARLRRQDRLGAGVSIVFGVASIALFAGGLAMVTDDASPNDLTGAVLIGSSIPLAFSAIYAPIGTREVRKWVASTYESAEAELWINEHNDALRAELGLTESDVRDIELVPR